MADPRNDLALGVGDASAEWTVKKYALIVDDTAGGYRVAIGKAWQERLNPVLANMAVYGVINFWTAGVAYVVKAKLVFSLNGRPVYILPVEFQAGRVENDVTVCALLSSDTPVANAIILTGNLLSKYAIPHFVTAKADSVSFEVGEAKSDDIALIEAVIAIRQSA